jgi:hypothetical protein
MTTLLLCITTIAPIVYSEKKIKYRDEPNPLSSKTKKSLEDVKLDSSG